jgi:RNA polymerase sigma-70 factor (ECF subfamily)
MENQTRREADKLSSTSDPRLRRSRDLNETPEGERVVARAVTQAKAGDREALRYLYLRYANNVYGYVRSIVRDDYEAEDITQHVFAKLITVINRYEARAVPFSRWLLRLAHNAAVDHLRSRNALPCEEIRLGREETDEDDADRLGTLVGALANLPEEQRSVLVLRHLAGLTPGEIAERMGKTESSIHGLHHRGRGVLQAQLSDLGAAPVTYSKATA